MERLGGGPPVQGRRAAGVVLAVQDVGEERREGGEEGEEVDTVVEELRGLSRLRIKPRVVISDTPKHRLQEADQIVTPANAAAASSSGIIERGRLCSTYDPRFIFILFFYIIIFISFY
jgi:hypothetical protein